MHLFKEKVLEIRVQPIWLILFETTCVSVYVCIVCMYIVHGMSKPSFLAKRRIGLFQSREELFVREGREGHGVWGGGGRGAARVIIHGLKILSHIQT